MTILTKPEEPLLEQLTAAQREAVTHPQGPLLILAGAGTGKTTVITRRIAWLIATQRANPNDILALTFTEKAADEMEGRVDLLVPYGCVEISISTFHAFGDRLIRDNALLLGLSPHVRVLSKPEQLVFVKQHLYDLPLERFRPSHDPTRYLEALVTVFARAKDEAVTPEAFSAYANTAASQTQTSPADEGARLYAEGARELARCYDAYQRLLHETDAMDFGDQVLLALQLLERHPDVLARYQQQFRYLLIDEFQDTNFAQFRLLQLLAPTTANITVVADDDQCLPRGTPVATPQGPTTIERIKIGQEVFTAVGKGHVGTAKVTKTFRSVKPVRLLTFKTKRGQIVRVTDNHKMFCYIPSTATRKDLHYTYLMHHRGLGWRMGITNDLAMRLRLERSADLIVGLRSFTSETQARYHEALWSLTYGIPTTVFKARKGTAIQGDLMRKLHEVLNTDRRIQRLSHDLRVDLKAHHACLDGVHRGNQRRVKINLNICNRRYRAKHSVGAVMKRPAILHTVRIQTSNPEAIKALRAAGVPVHKSRKGLTVSLAFADLQEAGRTAERLARHANGILETKFTVGRFNDKHRSALLMPAKNVLRGHYLPIFEPESAQVVYDEVVEIKEEFETCEVFDLEVERTHNFIANNVVVHNSIYKWRGASISNVVKFLEHYRDVRRVVLTENFRSSQPILDGAYRLIRHNDPNRLEATEGVDKRLIAMCERAPREPALAVFDTASSEADWIARQIQAQVESGARQPGDFAVLVRSNRDADVVLRALNICEVPWQFSGVSGLAAHDEAKVLLSSLKTLADPDDTLSWYHVISSSFYACPMEDLMTCLAWANRTHRSLRQVFEDASTIEVSPQGRQAIAAFLNDVRRLVELSRTLSPGQLLYRWLSETGWLKRQAAMERLQQVDALQMAAKLFDRLRRFEEFGITRLPELMQSFALFQAFGEAGEEEMDLTSRERVHLLTIHKAKGLEFPVVFMAGLVQGKFPTPRRRDPIELPEALIRDLLPSGDYHLQEERRLFYVAMTRAKEELYLTASYRHGGRSTRRLSQFVLEALNLTTANPPPEQPSVLQRIARTGAAQEPPVTHTPTPLPEPLRLSPYGLDDYLTCPLKFRYSHVLRIPIMRHHLVIYGAALHKAVEVFFKRQREGRPLTEEELLQAFQQAWSSEGFLSREHEAQRLSQGQETLRTFFLQQQQRPESPWLIEEKFTFPLDDFLVVGRWDRVDREGEEVVIIDYKSSEVDDQARANRRARESLQMAVYALAWNTLHGQLPKRLELRFLETGVIGHTALTDEDLETTKERLRQAASDIRALDFHPKPDVFSCRWCAYQSICPFALT